MKYEFEIKEISRFNAAELIQSLHYSKIMPKLTKHFLGCFLDNELVGVLTLGWGTQPKATINKLFQGLDTKDYFIGDKDGEPEDIDWIIQVEGHTDKNPINTTQFPSNWELSTARANTVLKLLLELGFDPQRLSAAGYGEFYPISKGKTLIDFQQNRRIELKLTSR